MLKPQPDGTSLRQAFDSYERDRGRKHPEDVLNDPLPAELQYLMRWFWELHTGRPVSMAGYLPIPSTEILAWAQLNRTDPRPWELRALRGLDTVFLRIMGG